MRSLLKAARKDTLPQIQALLDAGADPNVRDKEGNSPLMIAARHNHNHEVVRALLAVTARPIDVALMEAAHHNPSPAVVRALLDAGADPNARSKDGKTPLIYAACYNYGAIEVVQALLAAGADPNARSRICWPPLVYAARYNTPAVVQVLLDAGANPNARSRIGGTTALSEAVISMMMIAPSAKPNKAKVILALLAAGAEPDAAPSEYRAKLDPEYNRDNRHPAEIEALEALIAAAEARQ